MNIENIIKDNAYLIWKISKYFYNCDKEDLYQAGVVGIIKAFNNYQVDGNTKFSTYAYNYIFGEMYNLAINKGIKISKDYVRLAKMINKGSEILAQKLLREPTVSEISTFLELDEGVVKDALMSLNTIESMDVEDEDNKSLYDYVPDVEVTSEDDKILLNDSINLLSELEQNIIKSRYFNDLTQSETAKMLGITQVMVSRYEQKSLTKLREFMHN